MLKNKWLLKSTLLLGLALYPLAAGPQVDAQINEETNDMQEVFAEPDTEEDVEDEAVETMVQEEEDLPVPAVAVAEQVSYEVVYSVLKEITTASLSS